MGVEGVWGKLLRPVGCDVGGLRDRDRLRSKIVAPPALAGSRGKGASHCWRRQGRALCFAALFGLAEEGGCQGMGGFSAAGGLPSIIILRWGGHVDNF